MQRIKDIHFIGIGGSGMSGIAEVMLNQGYIISGSDICETSTINRLRNLGAKIFLNHNADYVNLADVIVVSSAISEDNPELKAACEKCIPVFPRAQMLGELMRSQYGIAVAGTHGKTTTTSLIASILTEAELDPTFVIGGLLNSAGAHAKLGASKYFIAEADESDASFLYLRPKMAVVTNIDFDHMHTYSESISCLKQTFLNFLYCLPFYGLAVVCIDDPIVRQILSGIARPIITYGFDEEAEVRALEFKQVGIKCQFKVQRKNNKKSLPIILNLPGRHNVLNALAAMTIAHECGVSDKVICQALAKFQGVNRRFQILGELNFKQGKVLLIDDYGHHPREIMVTLHAVRNAWQNRRVVLAFQPHRYTRTRMLFDDFVRVLSDVDVLLLSEIYSAGEEPIAGITGQTLAKSIQQHGRVDPIFVEQLQDLPLVLENVLQDGDILLMQGAGSIGSMAQQLTLKYGEFVQ